MSAHRRRELPETSLTFRLRINNILPELEAALLAASERWEEGDRARACDVAAALAIASKAEGLRQLAVITRSLASLMRLSREQIRPIHKEFADKVWELLGLIKTEANRVLSSTG
jgi:hypothetical protein